IHSGCLNWVQDWVVDLRRWEKWSRRAISSAGKGELRVFAGEYANRIIMPDCAVFISTLDYPTITMEVAYTETYENLEEDVLPPVTRRDGWRDFNLYSSEDCTPQAR
ncbi:hypothetical protein ACJ73_10187, partial [Blastomyces percursus]